MRPDRRMVLTAAGVLAAAAPGLANAASPATLIMPKGLEAIAAQEHFAPARRVGGLVFVSGMVGLDLATMTLADGLEAQTRVGARNVGYILAAAGLSLRDVVDATLFMVGDVQKDAQAVIAVWGEAISSPPPAATLVGTTGLSVPGALIEIKCIAAG
jgi:enamine deaminase RidA (YjgF/YER057c/UK114 family)